MKKFIFILLLFCLQNLVNAQNLSWRDINGDDIISCNTIKICQKGFIFVGSDGTGIYRSTNNGKTWQHITNGLPSTIITKINSLSDGKIYISTLGSGIYYSIDNGTSWVHLINEVSEQKLTSFIVHSSGYFFAGVSSDSGGLWRSKDQGLSWERIDADFNIKQISALTVNSKGYIIAACYNESSELYRSTDLGDTWSKIKIGNSNIEIASMCVTANGDIIVGTFKSNGTYLIKNNSDTLIDLNNSLNNQNVRCIDTDSIGDIFAGADGGLYLLAKDYSNWKLIYSVQPILTMDIFSENEMLIGDWQNQIYISNDTANHWTHINMRLLSQKNIISFTCLSDTQFVAGTDASGIFYYKNGNMNWETCDSGLPQNKSIRYLAVIDSDEILAGLDSEGVYISKDYCQSWFPFNKGIENKTVKTILVDKNKNMYVGTNDGIFKKNYGDSIWVESANGLSERNINCMAIDSAGQLFAGSEEGSLYKSNDYGNNWIECGTLSQKNKAVTCIAIDTNNLIFIGTAGNGIYRSTDYGANWQSANLGLTEYYINSIIISNKNDVIAATTDAIYYSSIHGDYWLKNSGNNINTLVYFNNKIYSASKNGVFVADSIIRDTSQNTGGWVQKNGYIQEKLKVASFTYLKYSKNDNYIITNDKDSIYMKWDAKSGSLLKQWPHFSCNDAFEDDKEIVTIAFDSNSVGAYAKKIDLSNDSMINIIKLPDPMINPQIITNYNGFFFTALTPDNSKIVISGDVDFYYDGIIWDGHSGYTAIWDYDTGEGIGTLYDNGHCISLAFSKDNKYIAFSSEHSCTQKPPGGTPTYVASFLNSILDERLNRIDLKDIFQKRIENDCYEFTFSNDSQVLAGIRDSLIYLWNLDGSVYRQPINYLKKNSYNNSIWELLFSLNDKFLIGGFDAIYGNDQNWYEKNSLLVWHVESGKLVDSLDFSDSIPSGKFVFTPDSNGILIGCSDGILRIINPDFVSKKLKSNFIADSNHVISGQPLKFWDVSYGNPVSWHWDFGDGDSSFDKNPVHIYQNQGLYTVSLTASDGIDSNFSSKIDYVNVKEATAVNDKESLSELQASVFPNPFSELATVEYQLNKPVLTKISLINSIGNEIKVLSEGIQQGGKHKLEISTYDLPQGVYFCRVQIGNRLGVLKLILIK